METLKTIISILAIAIVLILTGCGVNNINTNQPERVIKMGSYSLTVVVLDGCEYLYGAWGNATVLTHKGNCINHKDTIE
jgi:hypothetical protein